MIPVECDLTRRPMSEQIVFEAIRKGLSDEWYVFHSFDGIRKGARSTPWNRQNGTSMR